MINGLEIIRHRLATPLLLVALYVLADLSVELFIEFFTTKRRRETCLVCHRYIGSPFKSFLHRHLNGFHKENFDDFAAASLGGRLENYYKEKGI
ncbi:MAG: hypothetical protein [Caudoviricetes sp.]|nr:MAG: hypothetical protein [Caudoviricetes sp.]